MTVSDQTTLISDLKQQVQLFISERDWDQFHTPKDLSIGLITEASELLEHFRFRSEDEIDTLLNDEAFKKELRHELADCLYFILAICNKLDFDMTLCLNEKMALAADRYPIYAARGRNTKYTNLEIQD